ncbi:MAG: hypothetical protein ACOH2R_13590 [Pseudomonas sp.]
MYGDESTSADDLRIRRRADWALGVLGKYASVLRGLNARINVEAPEFANGM